VASGDARDVGTALAHTRPAVDPSALVPQTLTSGSLSQALRNACRMGPRASSSTGSTSVSGSRRSRRRQSRRDGVCSPGGPSAGRQKRCRRSRPFPGRGRPRTCSTARQREGRWRVGGGQRSASGYTSATDALRGADCQSLQYDHRRDDQSRSSGPLPAGRCVRKQVADCKVLAPASDLARPSALLDRRPTDAWMGRPRR
jgi:hypothetical protein